MDISPIFIHSKGLIGQSNNWVSFDWPHVTPVWRLINWVILTSAGGISNGREWCDTYLATSCCYFKLSDTAGGFL